MGLTGDNSERLSKREGLVLTAVNLALLKHTSTGGKYAEGCDRAIGQRLRPATQLTVLRCRTHLFGLGQKIGKAVESHILSS